MGQALAGFTIFIVIAGVIMITLTRRTRDRMRDAIAAETGEPPANVPSKRQQKIMAATSAHTATPKPTIEELVAAEAEATGVNEIDGGDGLDVSLKLRVFWRDEVVRKGCEDGHLEFRIDDGATVETAATEDVRLVCVRDGTVQEPLKAAIDPAAARDAGNSDYPEAVN